MTLRISDTKTETGLEELFCAYIVLIMKLKDAE